MSLGDCGGGAAARQGHSSQPLKGEYVNNVNALIQRRYLLVWGLVGAAAACSVAPIERRDLLAFLEPTVTTQAEVTQKLGSPAASYEQGRIVTYRLSEDAGGYRAPKSYESWKYSLVLEFDGKAVLARHALVKVRDE